MTTITRRTAVTLALQTLVARAAAARGGPTPFGLGSRCAPAGDQASDLLPLRVGDYARETLPASARVRRDEELFVTYRRGADTVSIGASLPDTVAEARAAVATAAQETRDELRRSHRRDELPRVRQDLTGDPAYVAVSDFVAWSRGRHVFAARGSSPRALAAFMQAFPY